MEDRVNVIQIDGYGSTGPQGGYQLGGYQTGGPGGPGGNPPGGGRKKGGWKKGLLVFVIILVVVIVVGSILIALLDKSENKSVKGTQYIGSSGKLTMSSPYIGELYVSGEIGGSSGGLLGDDGTGYHHSWTLDRIDDMMDDRNNKGIFLYVDTPGGAVFETDELYLKLQEYKEVTGRPVYTYMASQATSGGYYVSAATDRIYANRNCWTGSIGVIMGPMYDIKGLLDKYDIKTTTIASGKNKSMGSMVEHMTDEQKAILQELIDEAYDQFVDCIVKGRGMKEEKVRELADGRIYSASQAKANGLIDEVSTQEEATAAIKAKAGVNKLTPIVYDPDLSMMDKLIYSISSLSQSKAESDLAVLNKMMEENQQVQLYYMAEMRK